MPTFASQIGALKLELRASGKQAVVAAARQAFAEAQRANTAELGQAPPFRQLVDGSATASLESVKPGGRIVYLFDVGASVLTQSVDYAVEQFVRIAPVGSRGDRHPGRYRDSLRLLINGSERDAARGGAVTFKAGDLVQLTTLLPYSRRIEIGKTESGRAFIVEVPGGVLHAVAQRVRARFGRLVNVTITFENFPGFETGTAARRRSRTRAASRRASSYPIINFTVR